MPRSCAAALLLNWPLPPAALLGAVWLRPCWPLPVISDPCKLAVTPATKPGNSIFVRLATASGVSSYCVVVPGFSFGRTVSVSLSLISGSCSGQGQNPRYRLEHSASLRPQSLSNLGSVSPSNLFQASCERTEDGGLAGSIKHE